MSRSKIAVSISNLCQAILGRPADKADKIDSVSINALYEAFLGRSADKLALSAWANKITFEQALENILVSDEFKPNLARLLSIGRRKEATSDTLDTENFYKVMDSIGSQKFVDLMNNHTYGGDYYEFHKRRFVEMHTLITHLSSRRPVSRVLEISTMPFTTNIYRRYLGEDTDIYTVDLPSSMGGPDRAMVESWGVKSHVEVDLNGADLTALADDLTKDGKFDLIVASEVVEHLQRDFAEIAKFCLDCSASDGITFVSTPNYLSSWRMLEIANQRSPQQRFLNFDNNRGGHHHYREYTMKELAADVSKAGGVMLAAIYSDCYGIGKAPAIDLRDCLVVLFGPQQQRIF